MYYRRKLYTYNIKTYLCILYISNTHTFIVFYNIHVYKYIHCVTFLAYVIQDKLFVESISVHIFAFNLLIMLEEHIFLNKLYGAMINNV